MAGAWRVHGQLARGVHDDCVGGAWKMHWVCMGSATGGNGEAGGAAGSATARAEEPAAAASIVRVGVGGGGRRASIVRVSEHVQDAHRFCRIGVAGGWRVQVEAGCEWGAWPCTCESLFPRPKGMLPVVSP